tara:strand:+ start:3347 stop:3580 length:234 start_codon:yes stop_codon:yes gene_type:complete
MIWQNIKTSLLVGGCMGLGSLITYVSTPPAPECLSMEAVEAAMWDIQDEIAERRLLRIVVGTGYHPLLQPPEKKDIR